MSNCASGTYAPLMGAGKAGLNLLTGAKNPIASAFKGVVPNSRMGRVGATLGGAGLGAMALGHGTEYLKNKVNETATGVVDEQLGRIYNQAMPQLKQEASGFLDQYMQSRGLANPETGQFDPTAGIMRNGGVLGQFMGGTDQIFRSLGMDPSRMSPIQKMMVLGGALGMGGGAAAGSPGLMGASGVAMAGGLAPSLLQGRGGQ